MPGLLDPRLLEEESQRMVVVLRLLEGFTRRRTPIPAPVPGQTGRGPAPRQPGVPDLTVGEFFRRCQWE
jgi:hypothetical protein